MTKEEKKEKVRQQVREDLNDMHHPTGATYLGEGMYINRNGNIIEEERLW